MCLTDKEQAYFDKIRNKTVKLNQFMSDNISPPTNDTLAWFKYIAKIREIQGNTSNDQSFLATMLAKDYLMQHYDLATYDAAEKPQGAAGLDIDERTQDGKRIIAEIKSTVPYGKKDLGSAQRTSFQKDFAKLRENEADHKFFFVTDQRTYDIVIKKYKSEEIPDVDVVLLIES